MLRCPRCQTAYPPGTQRCVRDGVRLEEVRGEHDPLVGKTVAGRYEIVERLGVGGMGTVYRARQKGLVRDVALKILKREVSTNPDAVARFQREAKAMSLLAHPNTVRVFDFGQTPDGLLYLAMELLEGETLGERFQREPRLPPEEAIEIARQILSSLHEAHSKGLVHRDMKPDNIFLAELEGHEELVVKVLDFGIAKAWSGDVQLDQHETQAGTVFGTPRYMSPEQAQGHPLDPRSDLYSVGILLYQMLTGTPPFVDDDAVVVMAKHIREKPVPVRRRAPDVPIPASLERIVTKALQKDPDLRFQDAPAFDAALQASLPDVARERQRMGKLPGALLAHLRSAPAPAKALAAGLLVGAVGLATALLLRSEPASSGDGPLPPDVGTTVLAGSTEPPRPASDPPARPTRPAGVLRTDPSGAEVWSDGRLLGRTPFSFSLAPEQRMKVQLRLDGYEPRETELVGGESERTVVLAPRATRAAARDRNRSATRRDKGRSRRRGGGRTTARRTEPRRTGTDLYERFE